MVIQTMWKDRLSLSELKGKSAEAICSRINFLGDLGCSLLRFGVPDIESAETLGELAKLVSMPLVADIHFDHKIALRCLDFPIAKIRINPGNIGSAEKRKAVLEKAADKGIPIRIGINAGSLPLDLRKMIKEDPKKTSRRDTENTENAEEEKGGGGVSADSAPLRENIQGISAAEALVKAAERELAFFDEFNFTNVLVSMKASTVADTIEANRLLAAQYDIPLHIGVTEAGPLIAGVVRNSTAIIMLLREGIGDTIRVSLSDSMENEVIAGREILLTAFELCSSELNRSRLEGAAAGVKIISCPRCGRAGFDTHGFINRWMAKLYAMPPTQVGAKTISVAVMGCVVNGPGEARGADLGITGAGNKVLIFRNGNVTRTIDAAEADEAFEEELGKM